MDSIVQVFRAHLHPEPFPRAFEDVDGIQLLLARPSWFGAKYALALVTFGDDPATAQVGRVRRMVDAYLDSSLFSGCGLIIQFVAPEARWPSEERMPSPDRHGCRSTIVQAMVWLDPQTGKYKLQRSRWGPLKFGLFCT